MEFSIALDGVLCKILRIHEWNANESVNCLWLYKLPSRSYLDKRWTSNSFNNASSDFLGALSE